MRTFSLGSGFVVRKRACRATLRRLCHLERSLGSSTNLNGEEPSSRSRISGRVPSRSACGSTQRGTLLGEPSLVETSEAAAGDRGQLAVVPGFATAEEGESLLRDIARSLRGKRYLYDHWDGAIEGYRETEKVGWGEATLPVVQRLKEAAEKAGGEGVRALDEVHVLDLADDGFIRPHIDSIKFCGDVIAGLSLASECVMVFQHEEDSGRWIRALLPPLSLYIMRGCVRYKYTHAIPLVGEKSRFKGQTVSRGQRVSVISRTHPPQH